MHPQLQAIVDDFGRAETRLHRLYASVPHDVWNRRPNPQRWSVAECVAHLNLTSSAYLSLLDEGLAQARRLGGAPPRHYRRDLIGWLLWKSMPPPVRQRVKTAPAFVPTASDSPAALVAEFERLQAAQSAAVRNAEGLPITRVKVRSPFNARVKYTLYSALTILPAHQHRHLWQAEQAWEVVRSAASGPSPNERRA